MTAPLYAIAYVSMTDKKEKLERVWRTIPGNEGTPVEVAGTTLGSSVPTAPSKEAMLAHIHAARAAWRDRQPQTRVEEPHFGLRGRSGISAAECNEWLRSLPTVPLHGEGRA